MGSPLERGSARPAPTGGGLPQARVAPLACSTALRRAWLRAPVQRHAGERARVATRAGGRSEEHTSELQSRFDLVCRLLLEKKKKKAYHSHLTEPTLYVARGYTR